MVASLQGSVGTVTKEGESTTGYVWAAGFHHVMARSCLACILKLMNHFFNFPIFFSGHSKPHITETADTESTGTGVRHYVGVTSKLSSSEMPAVISYVDVVSRNKILKEKFLIL
jgi:hypothetical protein